MLKVIAACGNGMGSSQVIKMKISKVFKKLGVDIVLTRVNGAFYEKPKWRSRRYHTPVSVTVERILTKEEISSMSADEINKVIVDTISNDASRKKLCKYPQQDKADHSSSQRR